MNFKIIISAITLVLTVSVLSSCMLFEASWRAREKEYYETDENYIVLTATVIAEPRFFKEDDYYLLNVEFDDKETVQYERCVEINKANGDVLERNGYFKEISEGDKIQITLAPEIFGDGYIIPAVGIRTEEKVYLDFKTGKSNLMATYR
ncbi:MAG: hypothetical protein E7597_06450 [Ruminococcaceae bacterium]|nr:hypothetical protein [Oscillospiraceae bacterium]